MLSGAWLIVSGFARRVLSSPWGRAALTLIFLVIACISFYRAGQTSGRKAEAKRNQELQQRAMVAAQERYRKQEETHAREIQELQSKYAQQQQQAASVDARVMADLGSGNRRLRFPVASRCPTTPATAAPTGRADDTATADLAPATAEALYGIAADGDQAIRQLTALQAWARDAVKLCGRGVQ